MIRLLVVKLFQVSLLTPANAQMNELPAMRRAGYEITINEYYDSVPRYGEPVRPKKSTYNTLSTPVTTKH